MTTPLDLLNDKFSGLLLQQNQGKVISTDLKAESKPSGIKKIIFNVFTLGIYSLIYDKRHNPEKVVRKINNEIDIALRNYKLNNVLLIDVEKLMIEKGVGASKIVEAVIKNSLIEANTNIQKKKLTEVISNVTFLTSSILKK